MPLRSCVQLHAHCNVLQHPGDAVVGLAKGHLLRTTRACLADGDDLGRESVLVVVCGGVHIVRDQLLVLSELDGHYSLKEIHKLGSMSLAVEEKIHPLPMPEHFSTPKMNVTAHLSDATTPIHLDISALIAPECNCQLAAPVCK